MLLNGQPIGNEWPAENCPVCNPFGNVTAGTLNCVATKATAKNGPTSATTPYGLVWLNIPSNGHTKEPSTIFLGKSWRGAGLCDFMHTMGKHRAAKRQRSLCPSTKMEGTALHGTRNRSTWRGAGLCAFTHEWKNPSLGKAERPLPLPDPNRTKKQKNPA